ncbi:MAG: TolC family protein [Candidatus Auribacterota bacterium]|jgi:outer membrane protein TolC|nr:TolC family protein [Candidatus Auribacterota bacterium]
MNKKIQIILFLILLSVQYGFASDADNNRLRDEVSLGLFDCFALALDNNIDISVIRHDPVISDWQIFAQKAIFDPSFGFNLMYADAKTPAPSITRLSTGLTSIQNESLSVGSSVSGLLPTGTLYSLSYSDNKSEGTTTFFAPEYDSRFGIRLEQPLLRNFGFDANIAQINIAIINKKISCENLRQTVIEILDQVQSSYWDLVFAIRDLEVKKESLELAKTLLRDNKKRVEVGILPPIEITQSEAGVASREEAVILAQQAVSDRQNDLKVLLYMEPSDVMRIVVKPTDIPELKEIELSVDKSLEKARQYRPKYRKAKMAVDSEKINMKYQFNQRFPEVNFVGEYKLEGVENNFSNALDSMAADDTREWLLGVEVTIPLGNRLRRSNYQISKLEMKKRELELRKIELDLVREVDNAVANIRTDHKRVKATVAARILAEEALKAETRRLETGTSTSHDVLQFQEELSRARVKEIQAIIDLRKSYFELYRVEGTVLEELDIEIDEFKYASSRR